MPVDAWLVLGALLAVNLFCRFQAERRRVDEQGNRVHSRFWHIRLHAPEAYPTESGSHYRNGVLASALLFMLIAVYYMLRTHAG